MVRCTRLSFDDGMNVNFPAPRDTFDEEEFEEGLIDEQPAPEAPAPSARDTRRGRPDDRRNDRRHLAGADWLKPHSTERPADAKGEGSDGDRRE